MPAWVAFALGFFVIGPVVVYVVWAMVNVIVDDMSNRK